MKTAAFAVEVIADAHALLRLAGVSEATIGDAMLSGVVKAAEVDPDAWLAKLHAASEMIACISTRKEAN